MKMLNDQFAESSDQDVSLPSSLALESTRPAVLGKFIYVANTKFWVRGVTYGTFRPNGSGEEYHDVKKVERDFSQIAANGFNAVRTYTVPPRWLLDAAQDHGLRVMVGIPWEQHIAFLDDRKRCRAIVERVRAAVRACAGHSAVLCYAVGNEIPAPIVRWHGCRKIEQFIERLYQVAKSEDPEGLVTYVNYPTTEYLQLPFLDLLCFNVYLETKERFEAYLARLQNIAGDRPLVMGEIGLDSRRAGEEAQARALEWQVSSAFASGCAGSFVFSWTDEWHRGNYDIEDWDFGLTSRSRQPKPALAAVRKAFDRVPFPRSLHWPRITVVVCTYNGSKTIRDCLEGLLCLDYPDFEVIVVDDGSSDGTGDIARQYGFRVISTKNHGLSSARNTGMRAACGEIVAYLDDDAYPDPDWLTYLAAGFMNSRHAAFGGPNIPPRGDGLIAECVANAPGGPVHVLVSDQEAEHIPGCNMAFRKAALQEIGGFDPRFRAAGDDVDVCWRLQDRGYTLGFSPAAMVWHHRRNSVRAYWKQQVGYGKAEALLERKWPEKYNAAGHLTWAGRVYGNGHTRRLGRTWRIYHGMWGTAPFQSRDERAPRLLSCLPLLPEWYLVIVALGCLSALGLLWTPLLSVVPLLLVAAAAPLAQAVLSGARASFSPSDHPRATRFWLSGLTAVLHLLQPLARLWGRLRWDLTPWRKRGVCSGIALPRLRTFRIWSERWQDAADRLRSLELALGRFGVSVSRGGNYDRWDLEARDGTFGAVRMILATEEHGAGKQLVRLRAWPTSSTGLLAVIFILLGISLAAVLDRAWIPGLALATMAVIVFARIFHDCSTASAATIRALKQLGAEERR
jgi:GT2 family glycosyltransferase